MSVLTLQVDEVMRTLSAESSNPFVVHDKEVDIVRFAINSGFADIVLDGQVALRVMYQRPGETEVRAQTLTYYDTDGLHNYYDWQLSQSDLAKNGSLMVALCILDISGGEVSEWHTTPCAVRVLSTIHTDDSDEGDDTITPTVRERVAVLETIIQRVASGAPIVVSSMSAMTDTDQIYVLSTDRKWYYHNGTTWVSGGTYGAVATDTTLTQSGAPADAKAVGDARSEIRENFTEIDVELADILDVISTVPTIFNRLQNMNFWTFGQEIVETTGANAINSKACRTAYIQFSEPTAIEIDDDDYIMCAWIYSSESISGAVYSPTESYSAGRILMIPKAETSYFRIGVKRVDGAVLINDYSDTTSDAYKILNAIKTYKLTSNTLNDGSAPINANAVKNNALIFKEYLDDETDLNNVSNSGIYVLLSSRSYTNSPIKAGFLHVYKIGTVKMQAAYTLGTTGTFLPSVYIRYGVGSELTITSAWRMVGRGRKTSIKMACFGDSIMYGQDGNASARAEERYRIPSILAYNLNIETTNYGVGSQGYLGLIDETAYDNISSKDLTQFNAMVMCYGVNDGYRDLGEWNSTDENTIMGQFNKIVAYVFTQNPSIRLIVVAPYNGRNVGTFPKYWYGERSHPSGYVSRQTLSDTLKQACEYYNIPYIEQKNSPINGYTIQTLIGTDGVHPSLNGYLQLGAWLSGEIGKLIG